MQRTGLVDYARLQENARLFRPRLLLCGASAYSRDWDYRRLREIADEHEAYLVMDMAHISGLIAAGEQSNPFEHCDVVTTTTHKTLRGPRAALIFYRRAPKGERCAELEESVNFAVFPSVQGGPHNHTIAAAAAALKQVATPAFKAYARAVRANARQLAESLVGLGYTIVTGGTDNHTVLWDVRPLDLTGSKLERLFELASISVNKNSILGDKSAMSPGGIRLGTPALTSRGLQPADFAQVALFLHRGAQIALSLQQRVGKKLADFSAALEGLPEIAQLRADVQAFAKRFPMPGFDVEPLRCRAEAGGASSTQH